MKRGFLHLSGAFVEHFREGIAPFRLCYINGPNRKSKEIQIFSSKLIYLSHNGAFP